AREAERDRAAGRHGPARDAERDRPAARREPARDAERDRPAGRRTGSSPRTPADRREAMVALAPGGAAGRDAPGAPARRTVRITGRTVPAPRPLDVPAGGARRRAPRARSATVAHRPDRIAMWAVVLGFLLIAVAATSSHAATRSMQAGQQPAAAQAAHGAARPPAARIAAPLVLPATARARR
ncbi:MAG TPA: hypothetical protein VLB47_00705, partial [Solirubrobacteraceae bacterium]|nr:hypothetical protein [Solirubrobacteraceae bacterium]